MALAQHTASAPAAAANPARNTGRRRGARVPDGTRVYAVGDIHGRLDLLDFLLRHIRDDAADAPMRRVLVLLGDYIDRGEASAGVLERLLEGPPAGFERVMLKGNHEDSLNRFLAGEMSVGPSWLTYGGRETLESYGIDPPPRGGGAPRFAALRDALAAAMPASHKALLGQLALSHTEGGYLFVHAGVRPGVPLAEQTADDLMWIREPFLSSDVEFGAVVVHGHSISAAPDVKANRIGIDTGAYDTNHLTCLVLQGSERRFLTPRQGKDC